MSSAVRSAQRKRDRTRGRGIRARLGDWFRRSLTVFAFLYPALLLVLVLALLFVGERWWVTTVTLYLPRLIFGLPLPFLVGGLLLVGRRRLLWTQAVAAFLVIFPLMGLVLPWSPSAEGRVKPLRVLSVNVNSGYFGWERIAEAITGYSPDIVLAQEASWPEPMLVKLRERYPYVETSTQFVIASRFPIAARTDPDKLPYYGRQRSPRFMRYVVATPLGTMVFYSVHPVSPRGAFGMNRVSDLVYLARSGKLMEGEPEADLQGNAGLRDLQIAAVARMSEKETLPFVIAGDTNLPTLSAVFRRELSDLRDAFREAGSGFGYTFPANHPWLRLDRILGSKDIRFVSFEVGCAGVSDHLCVVADLERENSN